MLYIMSGISKNCLHKGNWGQGKILNGKAGTHSKLMPIFIMYTWKGRNIGHMPRSGVIYIERGMLGKL